MSEEKSFLESGLTAVVNRVLRLDPETLQRLGALQGKTIRIHLGADAEGIALDVEPSAAGLRLLRAGADAPDVTLRGSIPLFARLARTGIAAGELQISGDVELGSRFKRILEDIDIDWEEPLARVVGDVAAHQIGRAVRATRRWGEAAAGSLARDAAEYFQEESRVLASRLRVEEFLRAVDRVRTDVDRLSKRLENLETGRR